MCANSMGLSPRISQHPAKHETTRSPGHGEPFVWYEVHLSFTEFGTRSGRDLSSLSQVVNRLRKRAVADALPAIEPEGLKKSFA
jgi:hypothetical protein